MRKNEICQPTVTGNLEGNLTLLPGNFKTSQEEKRIFEFERVEALFRGVGNSIKMPPKKAVKTTKKKKKAAGEKTELTVEDKYKRTMEEIECLKVELATRTEHARRARDKSARMEERMHEAKAEVIQEQEDKRDISTDLTRQYKMMQSELGLKIHILEQTVTTLRSQLASAETELQQARKERDDIREEKDRIITDLQFKIDTMESAYENLLHDTLDRMVDKVEEAKKKWISESKEIQENNKRLLLAFGLNPLEI